MTKRQWMMISMAVLSVAWVPLLFIPSGVKKDPKALVAELPGPYNAADPIRGQDVFKACVSCHTTTRRGQRLNGPNLFDLFGNRSGLRDDFPYSDAMKAADFEWNAAKLDAFIADPQAVIPGTRMPDPGVDDPQARRDLVAYLKVATSP